MHSLFTTFLNFARRTGRALRDRALTLWRRYRALRPRTQLIAAVVAGVLLIGLIAWARSGGDAADADTLPSVSLETVGALSGGDAANGTLFGTVRSVTESAIVAKTGGAVTRVNASVGQTVAAGTVLASMENAAESAAVLSAEGSYEAALAARAITKTESSDAVASARTTFRASYTTIESALENYVDPLFVGANRVAGLTVDLEEDRRELGQRLASWRYDLPKADATDPLALLTEAESITEDAVAFLDKFARAVNANSSGASATQRAGVATARASLDGVRSSLLGAQTAVEVAARQSASSGTQVSSADASVKQALGALRAAEASYERTIVRAPIAGTVTFLPLRVGDYVSAQEHVATVERAGALEIVAFVSEETAAGLSVGDRVTIESDGAGTISFVSPALDPVAKQVEVRVAADEGVTVLSGESVRMTLANAPQVKAPEGPAMLPLAAVKLSAGSRVVFSVDADSRLVANPVEVGEVRGDRIEIVTPLALDLLIVRDARGLSAGEEVAVIAK